MEHNKLKLRIPAGRRRTKWLFTSMEEDLNSGLQRTYSYFEKGCRKKCARDNPERYSCRTYFCCFPLALANTFPWPFVLIFCNFFEKKRTQNHPQCLSGLSRALFPTTLLEIAVSSQRSAGRDLNMGFKSPAAF